MEIVGQRVVSISKAISFYSFCFVKNRISTLVTITNGALIVKTVHNILTIQEETKYVLGQLSLHHE